MRLIGGGARARFWNQIMADIYGIPVYRMSVLEEATSMGAALAGGIGVGLYAGFDLAETMNPVAEIIEPNPDAHALYSELSSIFADSYHALEPVFERLHSVGH